MTMVISTSPANRYISSLNCMCCVTLPNPKPKLTESTTSVRRKRSGRQCFFRHCSGKVCAEKLMKRRRSKRHCVHLRLSHEVISDYWKISNKNGNIVSGDDTRLCERTLNETEENVKVIHQCKEDIPERCYCNKFNTIGSSVEEEMKVGDILQKDIKCMKKAIYSNEGSPKERVSTNDGDIRITDAKIDETCQNITKSNILNDVYDNNEKVSPKNINKVKCEIQTENNSSKISKIYSNEKLTANVDVYKCPTRTIKKKSLSDTSLNKQIIAAECMNSILYRELQQKCTSMIEKELSINYTKNHTNIDGRQNKFAVDNEDVEDFSNDVQQLSAKQKQRYNAKPSMNKYKSTLKLQRFLSPTNPTIREKNTTNQKELSKFLCANCSCDKKTQNLSNSQWSSIRKESPAKFNSQSQKSACPCDKLKLRKNIDSSFDRKVALTHETDCAKYKSQVAQSKEKATLILYKNKKSNRFRTLEESTCENSSNSALSSSTVSTEFTENSNRSNRAACWCPFYKSSHYPTALKDRRKPSKYNARITRNSMLSSSSSLSSFKRHRFWTITSQNSVCQKERPVSSSSSYTNVQKWNKGYRRDRHRTSTYPSSTSSSSSLMSLSTFTGEHDLEASNIDHTVCNALKKGKRIFSNEADSVRESRRDHRWWRKPRFHEQEKKKTILAANERHISWDIKRAY